MASVKKVVSVLAAAASSVAAVTIAEINGNKFLSPFQGQIVKAVEGLVTAKGRDGFWLQSTTPDEDPSTSEGLYVFGRPSVASVEVGDIITVDGNVTEYRSNVDHGFLAELLSPANIVVVSKGNKVTPLVIGVDTINPPNTEFSALDDGDIFAVPNGAQRISLVNPTLNIERYGLDFWESLVGQLVTITDVYQTSRPNQFGDVWIRGDSWNATGVNSQGGITMLDKDSNPETIIVGTPLDGTTNPNDTKMGDFLGDVTGIVTNAFGFYRILPLTKVTLVKASSTDYPPVAFTSEGNCKGITFANYNGENLEPNSPTLPFIAEQIVDKMLLPDLIFMQEIQDDSGAANDGTTSANVTLTTLARFIRERSGADYSFAEVAPINNRDGGAPGGNIRVAYLYRPDVVELWEPNQGGPTDINEVLEGPEGPTLKFNPGRIAPDNNAWSESRKPLVAAWKPLKGKNKPFFTVNVHFTSKGGSTTIHGDRRTPINNGVDKRIQQAQLTGGFIAQILKQDPTARIITAGDFNDFAQVAPLKVFGSASGLLDLDDVADLPVEERYTYLFDQNSQALDHMFISPSLGRRAQYEHLHLNTWQNFDDQVSDHDPSVAKLNVCGC